MAKRLKKKDIDVDVHCMHPGWAATEGLEAAMKDFYDSNQRSLRSPAEGADTIVFLASAPKERLAPPGRFWFDRDAVRTHMPLAWTESSPAERELIWDNSAQYVGGVSLPAVTGEQDAKQCAKKE
jgi:NAD(P)-dependent dehydrogenase (short-subunit alcohol dehydrogenase family)